MPMVSRSTYVPPFLFSNGHIQSIYPTLFRKVKSVSYTRERIDTPDGDFIDIDWLKNGSGRLAILSHGLEGNTDRAYMHGMARALSGQGWDALAWNFRGCSGEMNRQLRFYHSGATEDLDAVVQHAIRTDRYDAIVMIGFSMGGNLTLKYIGERGEALPPPIQRAVAFSVPCDLKSSAIEMAKKTNQIYMKRFLRLLHEKVRAKMQQFPEKIDDENFETIRDFQGFDDRYTAPLHGFEDAEDYWAKASCKSFLKNIRIPSLLVNAQNDPFLGKECFPYEAAAANSNFFLEVPRSGGHVGFIRFNSDGMYWSEKRAMEFIEL
ncbi:alpha/beta fold hydrolase [bacterium]|nr:alpha/beta fold hydrolase [bacterium]